MQDAFWGNPFSGKCKGNNDRCFFLKLFYCHSNINLPACACNEFGSLGPSCDPQNGQCSCRPKYVGRSCSQCQDGFGDVAAGCRRCACHPVGASSRTCAADTGQCPCRQGVGGITCNACLKDHYGFSNQGCKGER